MDLFLKFESEEQATKALYESIVQYFDENGMQVAPIVKEDGTTEAPFGTTSSVKLVPKFVNIDIIGDVYKPTGETTKVEAPSGEMIDVPVTAKVDGYHVNVRLVGEEDPEALLPFSVTPNNPVRVWA